MSKTFFSCRPIWSRTTSTGVFFTHGLRADVVESRRAGGACVFGRVAFCVVIWILLSVELLKIGSLLLKQEQKAAHVLKLTLEAVDSAERSEMVTRCKVVCDVGEPRYEVDVYGL